MKILDRTTSINRVFPMCLHASLVLVFYMNKLSSLYSILLFAYPGKNVVSTQRIDTVY
jgi:hypothetical protein